MIIVDRETMKNIDAYAINELKIPSICLVERASLAVLNNINLDIRNSFGIVASVGNNGADGMALARNLLSIGKKVEIYIVGDIKKASTDFLINFESCKKMTDKIFEIRTIDDIEFFKNNLEKINTIIDAIFGTGLNRTVSGIYSYVIEIINLSNIFTISIDIPSGYDCDGEMDFGTYVDSDFIVSMQLMKKGLYYDTYFRDKIVVEDIGIAQKAIDKFINI
ncbi:NAD(P)H-hydrate epimerase [Anaerococcus sp. AGMB00486]|uniref:NAD(P)H-hydrate epimerase n=2 Tax=Anaerococcus TaxID=165779 RepID=A0ABX2N9F8_9FIRM|nr:MULTISPECIES: NAD(P)H-hydrate epimerase [Anaerococcus]MDY3006396.1 NAD(P)H-hydrate epimerase [Anaerococcus porci]MSS78475.1 NAD(P)H-hydrate epimerase [Anaerococcus porci]NVF11331.1 NAD(P)H-hydrate epimerase [Anaerococcus faecalis]